MLPSPVAAFKTCVCVFDRSAGLRERSFFAHGRFFHWWRTGLLDGVAETAQILDGKTHGAKLAERVDAVAHVFEGQG